VVLDVVGSNPTSHPTNTNVPSHNEKERFYLYTISPSIAYLFKPHSLFQNERTNTYNTYNYYNRLKSSTGLCHNNDEKTNTLETQNKNKKEK
jgi:hypothetical protein